MIQTLKENLKAEIKQAVLTCGYITESDDLNVILENSKDVYVIPSDIGWDDVGSWEAIDRYREKDNLGNVVIGQGKSIKGENNLLVSSNYKVVVEGLSDIYVIENDGKIIIGKKSNVVNVKELKSIV